MLEEQRKNIRVVVRVRPFNKKESEQNQRNIIQVLDNKTLIFDPDEDVDEFFFHGTKQQHRDITKRTKKKLNMEFDDIFGNTATNMDIFDTCTKPLISSVLRGYNCTVFVYGATGAGKTFTMLGDEETPGITFLTIKELFRHMSQLSDEKKFEIGISYLEVYNEQVMNLLTKTGPLKLREDTKGVVVSGLTLKQITNADELLNLLALGNKNRTQHPTDANAESSRSHAIFQVHIRMTERKTDMKSLVKLSMIDLAGSERAASTKCVGARFKEGACINKSLLALGNCINNLADGMKHVPYRDSNLTRILKDSLEGNCQTVMIANISPSSLTYEDTYNTLKYASRAKKIHTTVKPNVLKTTNMPKEYFIKKVEDQIRDNQKLKETIKQLESLIANSATKTTDDTPRIGSWYSRIDLAYDTVQKAQDEYYNALSREKVFNFKNKMRQEFEEARKSLLDSDACLAAGDSRVGQTPDSIIRGRELSQETKYLKGRFQEAAKEIEQVRHETQEQSDIKLVLDNYMKRKDADLEVTKSRAKHGHVLIINRIYYDQLIQLKNASIVGYKIIKENYPLMRTNPEVEKQMKFSANYSELVRLMSLIPNGGEQFAEDHKENEEFCDLVNLSVNICDKTVGDLTLKRPNSDKIELINKTKKKLLTHDLRASSIKPVGEERTRSNSIGNVTTTIESHINDQKFSQESENVCEPAFNPNETQVLSSSTPAHNLQQVGSVFKFSATSSTVSRNILTENNNAKFANIINKVTKGIHSTKPSTASGSKILPAALQVKTMNKENTHKRVLKNLIVKNSRHPINIAATKLGIEQSNILAANRMRLRTVTASNSNRDVLKLPIANSNTKLRSILKKK